MVYGTITFGNAKGIRGATYYALLSKFRFGVISLVNILIANDVKRDFNDYLYTIGHVYRKLEFCQKHLASLMTERNRLILLINNIALIYKIYIP